MPENNTGPDITPSGQNKPSDSNTPFTEETQVIRTPQGSAAGQSAPSSAGTPGLFGRKYKLTRKLGEGGMGAVYAAEDIKLGRKVAIKVLLAAISGSEEFKSRFMREARSQAQFNHPNIVTLYDSDLTTEGQPYMVMEYVEGKAMDEVLQQEGAFSLERTLHLFSQICAGVDTAHKHGIIHRDLKPSNLIISKDINDNEIVKILDLGLAKLVENASTTNETLSGKTVGATQAGLVLGTPQYMSPEQATGGQIDTRTDIYALGMILCEMLTGQLPYKAESAMQWIAKQIAEQPLEPTKIRPDLKLPKTVDDVFLKAVSKERNQRFDSAGEMLDAFKTALTGVIDVDSIIAGKKTSGAIIAAIFLAILLIGGGVTGYVLWNKNKKAQAYANLFNDTLDKGDNILHSVFSVKNLEINSALLDSMKSQYDEANQYIADDDTRKQRYSERMNMLDDLRKIAGQLKTEQTLDIANQLQALNNRYTALKNTSEVTTFINSLTATIQEREARRKKELRKEYEMKDQAFYTAALNVFQDRSDIFGLTPGRFDEVTSPLLARMEKIRPEKFIKHIERLKAFQKKIITILELGELWEWYDLDKSLEALRASHPYLLEEDNTARRDGMTQAIDAKLTAVRAGIQKRRADFAAVVTRARSVADHGVSKLPDASNTMVGYLIKGAETTQWPPRRMVADKLVIPFREKLKEFDTELRNGDPAFADALFAMIRSDGPIMASLPTGTPDDNAIRKSLYDCLSAYYFASWLNLANAKSAGARKKLESNEEFAKMEAQEAFKLYHVVLNNKNAPKEARDEAELNAVKSDMLTKDPIMYKLLDGFSKKRKDVLDKYTALLQNPAPTPGDWQTVIDGWIQVDKIASELKKKPLPTLVDRSRLDDPGHYLAVVRSLAEYNVKFDTVRELYGKAQMNRVKLPDVIFRLNDLVIAKTVVTKVVGDQGFANAQWKSFAIRNVEKMRQDALNQLKDYFMVLYRQAETFQKNGEWSKARDKYLEAQKLYSDPRFETLGIPDVIPAERMTLSDTIATCEDRELEQLGGKNIDNAIKAGSDAMKNGAYEKARDALKDAAAIIEKIRVRNPAKIPPSADQIRKLMDNAEKGIVVTQSRSLGMDAMVKEDWPTALKHFNTALKHLSGIPTEYKSAQLQNELERKVSEVQKHIMAVYSTRFSSGKTAERFRNFTTAYADYAKALDLLKMAGSDTHVANIDDLTKRLKRTKNYAEPPVLVFNETCRIEFVYVESPAGNFFISKYEITNSQYEQLVPDHQRPAFQKDGANHPVVNVSLQDAKDYAEALRKKFHDQLNGMTVQLPTEQQWIDAASFVPAHDILVNRESNEIKTIPESHRVYPWDDALNVDIELKYEGKYLANTSCYATSQDSDRKVMVRDGYEHTNPVDAFDMDVSFFGAVGMCGNVSEWVIAKPNRNDKLRVRGGAWKFPTTSAKVNPDPHTEKKVIMYVYPEDKKDWLGFRLILIPEK